MKFRSEYTGIRVTDLDAALRFFVEGLGMRVTGRGKVPETGGEVVDLVTDGSEQKLELNWYPPGSRYADRYAPGEALDHLAFSIQEGTLEEAIRHLERHGGKVRIEPFREGSITLAYVDSPDGHTVEIWVPSRP